MKKGLRPRFYPEAILSMLTGALFVLTLVNRAWIETAFSIDPDRGNGLVEWLVVGGLLVVTVVLGSLARSEWRRASAAAA